MNHPSMRPCLLLAVALACLMSPAFAQRGALGNPTGHPIGGQEGYGDWVTPQPGQVVADLPSLLAALAAAVPGSVVYVRDDAVIDMTDLWLVEIKRGVTLASGRGRNGSLGALIHTTAEVGLPLFEVHGTDARITGLRLRGPDTNVAPGGNGGNDPTGILFVSEVPTIWSGHVDNNELWGWPKAAVGVTNVYGPRVHHNHIHHNRREVEGVYGLGYGVDVNETGHAFIYANLFDHNRHDIACDGKPGTGYEASYNVVLDGGFSHAFDVHGGRDRGDGTNIAGTLFWVHHNTFLQDHDPSFLIRGYPLKQALVYSNEFRHDDAGDAVRQKNANRNLHSFDNATDVNYYPGWFTSFCGESFWRLRQLQAPQLDKIQIGDFDGDGCSDAVAIVDQQLVFSSAARGEWQYRNTAPVAIDRYRVGDFDDDGREDLFFASNGTWWVSRSGSGPWEAWRQSPLGVTDLGFGNFVGDGRTDVFYAYNGTWFVSDGGSAPFAIHNHGGFTAATMRFADFDGDGRTDVFRTNGQAWLVSLGGSSQWHFWNTSSVSLDRMGFGDFDGDGRADVFYGNGTSWYTSSAGSSPWRSLNTSSQQASALRFADFNGDGRCDVLSRQQ